LVVIAIIAILIGLLLPAVQKVREAAARSQCSNNLKQIGMATHNFQDTYGQMPPLLGGGYGGWSPKWGRIWGTPFVFILPFIEQGNLYDDMCNPSNNNYYYAWWAGQNNDNPYSKVVKTYVCPADPSTQNGQSPNASPWGTCSYGANGQVFSVNDANGVCTAWDAGRKIQTITDGSSNTILYSEKYGACTNPNVSGGQGGSLWGVEWGPWLPVFMNTAAGGGNAYAGNQPTAMFQMNPNPWDKVCDPYRANSPHTAIIQASLGDGSVRSINSGMSVTTWWYACTPCGGEVLGPDW
jgi:type II secretory pathway pseudopilin PulG